MDAVMLQYVWGAALCVGVFGVAALCTRTFVGYRTVRLEQRESTLSLTVVLPVHNEAARIVGTLDSLLEYLNHRVADDDAFRCEVLVVDDGSVDDTTCVALRCMEWCHFLRVLRLPDNVGKGGALLQGVRVANGERVLFVDSDNATHIDEIEVLEEALDRIESKGRGFVAGVRANVRDQLFMRRLGTTVFWALTRVVLGAGAPPDTQCGFKLMTARTAREAFGTLHIWKWAFDVELLYAVLRSGTPFVWRTVMWEESPGPKLRIGRDGWGMFCDILGMWILYALALW